MNGLGVALPGQAVQRWQQFEHRGMHELQYGSTARRLQAVGRPATALGLVVLISVGLRSLMRRKQDR